MPEIIIMGEMLVEIMRDQENIELYEPGIFKGPFPSGAPAIFIDTAARLGCSTAIIGGVGKDDFGRNILDRLKSDGVDCSHVLESAERSTGAAFVTYYSDGSRKFIFHMGNTPAVEAKAPLEGEFKDVKYMHIMGCSLMASQVFAREILKTMHMMRRQGTKISFDPNIREELFTDPGAGAVIREVLENTSVFMPGAGELLMLTEASSVREAVKRCFEYEAMEVVVVKNGSKGSTVYTRDEAIETKAYPVRQLDATGAGDCFDGAFIAGLVKGKSLKEAAQMGAAAGALNAAAFGPMEGKINEENVREMIDLNSDLEIIRLPKEDWEGTVVPMRYTTEEYYDLEIEKGENGYDVKLHRQQFDTPVSHYPEEYNFPDRLYQPHWENACAWGIVGKKGGGQELLACIETCPEEWSNRLLVTELWVHEKFRRRGIGHRLMAIAKEQAVREHRRAVILETQSCNTGAIRFYEREGFEMIGFDTCCYSNNDRERKELRINMGYFCF